MLLQIHEVKAIYRLPLISTFHQMLQNKIDISDILIYQYMYSYEFFYLPNKKTMFIKHPEILRTCEDWGVRAKRGDQDLPDC